MYRPMSVAPRSDPPPVSQLGMGAWAPNRIVQHLQGFWFADGAEVFGSRDRPEINGAAVRSVTRDATGDPCDVYLFARGPDRL